MSIFKALVQEPDLEWAFIDGSIVKAHQHSAGAASEENQAIGKSRGGNTTTIHMAVDAHGLPIDFEITGGKYTSVKLHQNLSKNFPLQVILLLIKAMIVRKLETLFVKNHPFQLSQEGIILKLAIQIWIGVFINIGI